MSIRGIRLAGCSLVAMIAVLSAASPAESAVAVSFAENFDDGLYLEIGGAVWLHDTSFDTMTHATGALPEGARLVEVVLCGSRVLRRQGQDACGERVVGGVRAADQRTGRQ